jgi:hypothetical protein
MSLLLRHLRLRAQTGEGLFGADIPLQQGLMLLRAENSRGKSTAVQSILYVLALERMITTRPAQALTAAMRDRLIFDFASKRETPVLESSVSLEMENDRGEIVTVRRGVAGGPLKAPVVRVWRGPVLSNAWEGDFEDMYVGRKGAVANPRGFHRFFAEFLGWTMPPLAGAEGEEIPLYVEQVFPLLFVEQRRGRGGIQAQMPAFSGVAEVRRRAIEFLLKLQAGEREAERQRLRAEEQRLASEWDAEIRDFRAGLVGQGLVVSGMPQQLTVGWPSDRPPVVQEARPHGGWRNLDALIADLRATHSELTGQELPQVEPAAGRSEERLSSALSELDELRTTSGLVREDITRDRRELDALQARRAALERDRREHADIVLLERLGSEDLERLHSDCPVCHRPLAASLVNGGDDRPVLSPQETLNYIDQQIELVEVMMRDGRRVVNAPSERWTAIHKRSAELRAEIRAIRSALVAPGTAPSAEVIARRLRIEERLDNLRAVAERLSLLQAELETLMEAARVVRARLRELPAGKLVQADLEKLSGLQQSVVSQLHDYEFGSFEAGEDNLSISPVDYLPRREDFDLQSDISASDSIRVIWAYLLGLFEVSRHYDTNHPKLLIFDEPRQQSANPVSFAALLRRAAGAAERGGQVLFATSEELGSLREMLEDVPHHLEVVEGYLLKRIE